jgi:hypothetical protein
VHIEIWQEIQVQKVRLDENNNNNNDNNSVALVRERTISTERPQLVGEDSANFLRIEGVVWSAQQLPKAVFSVF